MSRSLINPFLDMFNFAMNPSVCALKVKTLNTITNDKNRTDDKCFSDDQDKHETPKNGDSPSSSSSALGVETKDVPSTSSSEAAGANVPLEDAFHEIPLDKVKTEEDQVQSTEELSSLRNTTKVEIKKDLNVNPNNLTPGRAYIINHLSFEDPNLSERTGSVADVHRLIDILSSFRMAVEFISDGTFQDVKDTMRRISKFEFRNVSCLMIVIMSHGFTRNVVAAKDGRYSLDFHIMNKVLQNKTLQSKLKFIVTQTCKGSVDPMFLEPEGPRPTTNPSEILQLYSCVEGYVSYLHPKNGSIFIESLCKYLKEYGLEKCISYIAKKVIVDVKEKSCDSQIPMLHSNLTKKYVFGHYIAKSKRDLIFGSETFSNSEDE